MDEKNLAILKELKERLLANEPKPEIIYPFKSSATTSNCMLQPNSEPKKKQKKKRKKQSNKKTEQTQGSQTVKTKRDFRAENRRMVATHSNIARSYYSGEGNSLYAYSGGDVRPK